MGTIVSIIIGCLSVGIILSAPMGPIGILVVQRTMEKGRLSGVYTGIGAAVSDLFYCLLAGLGLSFVTDFITKYQELFQIGGSIILIVFAIFMILRRGLSTTTPGRSTTLRMRCRGLLSLCLTHWLSSWFSHCLPVSLSRRRNISSITLSLAICSSSLARWYGGLPSLILSTSCVRSSISRVCGS